MTTSREASTTMTRLSLLACCAAAIIGCGGGDAPLADQEIGSLADCRDRVVSLLEGDQTVEAASKAIDRLDQGTLETAIAEACGEARPSATVGEVAGKVRRQYRRYHEQWDRLFD
jgi:hypothetical protein